MRQVGHLPRILDSCVLTPTDPHLHKTHNRDEEPEECCSSCTLSDMLRRVQSYLWLKVFNLKFTAIFAGFEIFVQVLVRT